MNTWTQPEYKPDGAEHELSTTYPFWVLVDCYELCPVNRKETED